MTLYKEERRLESGVWRWRDYTLVVFEITHYTLIHYTLHYSTNRSLEGVNENEWVNSDTKCAGRAASFA